MNTLVQNQVITVPATTGTTIYKTQFASDMNYKHIAGIACMLVAGSLDQDIEIEFKDDNDVIFSYSPAVNWVKDSAAANKDLTEIFRAVSVESKGRNIYCDVKAKDTTEPVVFVVYYLQTNIENDIRVKPYNFETYSVALDSLPGYKNITLPNRYKKVVGIAAVTDSTEAEKIFLHVENSQQHLIDPMQLSALNVKPSTLYDVAFMPVEFNADGQELKLYFTAAVTVSGGVNAKVCFLLTD